MRIFRHLRAGNAHFLFYFAFLVMYEAGTEDYMQEVLDFEMPEAGDSYVFFFAPDEPGEYEILFYRRQGSI